MIGIVNYGAGNLKSVKKAFDFLGQENTILSSANEIGAIDRLVLPGVGSFGYAMEKIVEGGFFVLLKEWIESNRPFLGICLGLQLLFESSEESQNTEGLSYFKGECMKFHEKRVPQIGWNSIRIEKEDMLFKGISSGEFFYFVHSYYVVPEKDEVIMAKTNYGAVYTSVARRGNVYGVQFHPEKSGRAGLLLLRNWVEKC